jgi:hypothetical protein
MLPWIASGRSCETGKRVVFLTHKPHVRTRVNTRTGPNGAFRYVVRPAVRGRPKPRLLAYNNEMPVKIYVTYVNRADTCDARVHTLTLKASKWLFCDAANVVQSRKQLQEEVNTI